MVADTAMLHTVSRGEGSKTVLLVHGFLGTSRNLLSLARRLSESQPGWRIVLPDLRGHGQSPGLRKHDDLFVLADDVAELAAAESPQPVLVLGHSLGGRVALAALDRHPERIERAVLLDIVPSKLPSLTGPMQRVFERLMGAPPAAAQRADMRTFFLAGGIDAGLCDWVLTNLDVAADGSVHWRIDRAALARLHWSEGADDLWQAAERRADRLICLKGEQSAFVTPTDEARFHALGVPVHTVPNAGHFLHVDALNDTAALLAAATASA